ncbi:methyltransferase domain-containing protein [Amycolatopsis sp. NPDC051758]|uniref:methyltransferase domain-containing protein n=1 Tax=Amycolatopsis sp. NPDC051758 TaxID=3363935 RepID=UPI0037B9A06C
MNLRTDPARLRDAMVRDIVTAGHAQNPAVQAALATVPRHRFIPGVPVVDAYDYRQAAAGSYPGTGIEPLTIAMMLDQLGIRTGQTVLHIGTGTGYTAALAAEQAGSRRVVTIDRDQDVAAQARRALSSLGYDRIEVIKGDGGEGVPGLYDRIIVTASAYDLPHAWVSQLAPGGRLVVPLRFRGTSRSLVFERQGDTVEARESRRCSLPHLIGANHDRQYTSRIGPGGRLNLTWDDDQQKIVTGHGLDALQTYSRPLLVWSGVIVHQGESCDGLWLRLASTAVGTCELAAAGELRDLPPLAIPAGTPALVGYGSIAYLTRREIAPLHDATRRYELGAAAYGRRAAREATTYIDQVRAWDAYRQAHPTITVASADTPVEQLPPGQYLERPSHLLVLSFATTI